MCPRLHFINSILCLVCGFVLLAGCKKSEISYYEVPREESIAVEPDPTLPDNHPPAQGSGQTASDTAKRAATNLIQAPQTELDSQLSWDIPEHWIAGRSSSMRLGSYTVADSPSLDISITRFPGDVGGLLSNVNRWRGQIGLSPISADVMEGERTTRTTDFATFELVSLHNPETHQKMWVALLDFGGHTWFFKMTGPDADVDKERSAFLNLVDSVERDRL